MGQIFRPRANGLARAVLVLLASSVLIWALLTWGLQRSDAVTGRNLAPDQPVPFSHRHHVGGLGIDCRYCHAGVETAAFAGVPSTRTCMTCHSRLWTQAEMLEPVRDSLAQRRPLRWTRVYDLADFVYFDHSAHVNRGVGCDICHGRVDRMPLTRQATSLTMRFCLDCHRDPIPRLRPPDKVFEPGWQPRRPFRVSLAGLPPRHRLTDCYTCHR